jgi:hypothetical protein
MCPACITTLALVAASAGSSGGLTALVVKRLRRPRSRRTPKPVDLQQTSGEVSK